MRLCLLLLLLPAVVFAVGEDDLVKNLPGLNFQVNFKTYSGYLNANDAGTWKMHYTLTESRGNAATDPVLVWFNGGPGCSSFAGLFEELGPFYVNKDGVTLYENIYSWNQRANVLYLESPIGVGFSYDTTIVNYTTANDDQTAQQNYLALKDFFARVQPKYASRTFYLSGESYAGIYIPMLSAKLVDGINSGDFPNSKFQGAAIGNGFMNVQYLQNSLILWSNYHGRIPLDDWEYIKTNCNNGQSDMDKVDFSRYFKSTNAIDFVSDGSICGNLTAPWLILPDNMDQYNFYEDCYMGSSINYINGTMKQKPAIYGKNTKRVFGAPRRSGLALDPNTANNINYDSTDNQWGYACWNEDAVFRWANNRTVQNALNIDKAWQDRKDDKGGAYPWTDCNNAIYDSYHLTYNRTNQFFDHVINNVKTPGFRFLIYNGDVDTVCNYLGDSWHMRDVARGNGFTSTPRQRWWFRDQSAGFVQRYSKTTNPGITIDVLTVKGAGHMVPGDRPGPSMQMITNFMFPDPFSGVVNYTSTASIDPTPKPAPLNGTSYTYTTPTARHTAQQQTVTSPVTVRNPTMVPTAPGPAVTNTVTNAPVKSSSSISYSPSVTNSLPISSTAPTTPFSATKPQEQGDKGSSNLDHLQMLLCSIVILLFGQF